jgi:hypothetical protein
MERLLKQGMAHTLYSGRARGNGPGAKVPFSGRDSRDRMKRVIASHTHGLPVIPMLQPQVERACTEHELYLVLFVTTSGGW